MLPRYQQKHFIQATIQIYNPNYFTLDHIHNRLQYKLKLNDCLQQSLHFMDQYPQYKSINESILEEQSCVRDKEAAKKIMIGRYTKKEYEQISSITEAAQFVTIRNKSVSRKHGMISFPPIFRNNDRKSKTECFIPSYFYKVFKEEMPKQVLSTIRSFTFPTPVMLIKDLHSRIGTYYKLKQAVLLPKYFQSCHMIFPRKFKDPFVDTIQFAVCKVIKEIDEKIAEPGEQVIELSEKSLKNQRPKGHQLLQDTDIYIELGSEANIRLSNIKTYQRKWVMANYFSKIRKQVEEKEGDAKFYQIQRYGSEGPPCDLFHTIKVDVLNWNQDFQLEVKETYMLIARTKSEPIDFVIGRSCLCQIQIKKSDVSGKHCKLTFIPNSSTKQQGIWKIQDLDSTNGLWLRTKVIKVPLSDIVQTPQFQYEEKAKKQMKSIFKVGVAQMQMTLTRYTTGKIQQTLNREKIDQLDRSFILEDSEKQILQKVEIVQNDRNSEQKQRSLKLENFLDQIKSQSREEPFSHHQEQQETVYQNFLEFLNRQ